MQQTDHATGGVETDIPPIGGYENHDVPTLWELELTTPHWRLIQVTFMDRTDLHNELVYESERLLHPQESGIALSGNCFVLENTATETGFVLLKLEPLPHSRPVACAVDLFVERLDRYRYRVRLAGDPAVEKHAVIEYSHGRLGRTIALQTFQKRLRPQNDAHQMRRFLTNTWGDRNRDSRVCESFILTEIEAAARLGADVVQIDDGWQAGMTANAAEAQNSGKGLWSGYWDADSSFWKPSPSRFPNGLEPVLKAAAEAGLELGLWYSPDSANDFAHWEKDVAQLLALWRSTGVRFFKMDGIHCQTQLAHKRLTSMFDAAATASGGELVFDLDVTAQSRPGYWGLMGCGPLFVENRYTDWHGYWPHHTLRNLWKLSAWVDPQRLRFELLNTHRNRQKYANDPLAPFSIAPDVLFAQIMVSNPLGWFEVSELPDAYFETIKPLTDLWKQERTLWSQCTIVPVGEAPDGWGYCGFLIVDNSRIVRQAVIFRGATLDDCHCMALPRHALIQTTGERIAGQGTIQVEKNNLIVEIPNPQSFCWWRF